MTRAQVIAKAPSVSLPNVENAASILSRKRGFVWLDGDGSSGYGRRSFLACEPVETRSISGAGADASAVFPSPQELDVDDSWGDVPRWILALGFDARFSGSSGLKPIKPKSLFKEKVAIAHRYDAVLVQEENQFRIIAEDESAFRRLDAALAEPPEPVHAKVGHTEASASNRHIRAIQTALEHISQGEIYQVNLARRWRAPWEGSPLALFLAMRAASPVPLGAYVDLGDRVLCARTMELFLHWNQQLRRLVSRPIKGTVPASAQDAQDRLRHDPKERAEHSMIVDLVRNDLGSIAEPGTVRVEELLAVEPYRNLFHMVSTIACQTQRGITFADVLGATFPPGSVTGCPKERALEVIQELEDTPRGFYTGAIGHISRRGDLMLAVAIRLAEVRAREVLYFAGGGIVSASDPEKEVQETEVKARVFVDAVQGLRDRVSGRGPGV